MTGYRSGLTLSGYATEGVTDISVTALRPDALHAHAKSQEDPMKQSTLLALLVASLLWFPVLAGAQPQPEVAYCWTPPPFPHYVPCLTVFASPNPSFAGATVTLGAAFARYVPDGTVVGFMVDGRPAGGP